MTMPSSVSEPGRATAVVVYVLYLLSIPSFAFFALVGVIVALLGRGGAGPIARSHLDDQVRIWFVAFWWAVGLAILWVIGAVLVLAFGLGLLVWWLIGVVAFVVMLWFTIKSLLGLLALIDNRPR
jgi:uncharacterized membrane protein